MFCRKLVLNFSKKLKENAIRGGVVLKRSYKLKACNFIKIGPCFKYVSANIPKDSEQLPLLNTSERVSE